MNGRHRLCGCVRRVGTQKLHHAKIRSQLQTFERHVSGRYQFPLWFCNANTSVFTKRHKHSLLTILTTDLAHIAEKITSDSIIFLRSAGEKSIPNCSTHKRPWTKKSIKSALQTMLRSRLCVTASHIGSIFPPSYLHLTTDWDSADLHVINDQCLRRNDRVLRNVNMKISLKNGIRQKFDWHNGQSSGARKCSQIRRVCKQKHDTISYDGIPIVMSDESLHSDVLWHYRFRYLRTIHAMGQL